MKPDRPRRVAFVNEKVKKAYENLAEGPFEEKRLYEAIAGVIYDLRENPLCGVRVPSSLWPKQYARYGIDNLFKYDLPEGWRLIYYLRGTEVEIVSIILEWFDHKNYERRFGYGKK
ncbi:MAG: hypothetical protein V1717_00315 [Candidatus Micrarchaeota archaeon]